MAKYIDADKLRAEIEKRMEKHWDNLPDTDSPEDDWTHNELCVLGAFKELEHIEYFLNSLQQEQPEVDLDEETETWISTHIKVETGGIQLVNADELAKTVKEWGKCIARHFYELGLKAKEENK